MNEIPKVDSEEKATIGRIGRINTVNEK